MRIGRERKLTVDIMQVRTGSTGVKGGVIFPDSELEQVYNQYSALPYEEALKQFTDMGMKDLAERLTKERDEKLAEEKAKRAARLDEINALPENERLVALLAAGFDEEAKALSEFFASKKEEESRQEENEAVSPAPDEEPEAQQVAKKPRATRGKKSTTNKK